MAKVVKPGITALYPTPVVLVASVDESGNPNIITIAWTGIVCSDPPIVGISIRPQRYSHKLITTSGDFVINMPTLEILKQTDYCGFVSGRDVDKFSATGFTPLPSSKVKPPLIRECPVNLECRTVQILPLGVHHLFLGEVLAVHFDEHLLDDSGNIQDFLAAKPIGYIPITREYVGLGEVVGRYGFTTSEVS